MICEMEEHWKVKFTNVAQTYFPQTRVECCFTLSSDHTWTSRDWIGLFPVGWTSVRDYHTYVWASVPENCTCGKNVNSSIIFQPSYLPSPGATAYQFVYLNETGAVCAVSPHFTFSAPKPLDELVTLEEERNGEEGNEAEDLLLVVPKAQILQSHLEASQKEVRELQKKLDEAATEMEKHIEKIQKDRGDLEMQNVEMKNEIQELRERLTCSLEKIQRMEEREKDMLRSHENMSTEFSSSLAERSENQQRIKDLEEDLNSLLQQKQETEAEMNRMKDRLKKMSTQRKDEEDERRNLQKESKHWREELLVLQERLESSERSSEALRRDLGELGALQSQNQTELHQIRLQAAQTTLQLSQANLSLREGQADWAKERENMRKNAELDKERMHKVSHELQKKEEWLQEERAEREKLEMELGNEKACNRELRASLRAMQKEREQHHLEKQELLDHIRLLQLRMERKVDVEFSKTAAESGDWNLANSSSATSTLKKALHHDIDEVPDISNLLQKENKVLEPTEQGRSSTKNKEKPLKEEDNTELEKEQMEVQLDPNSTYQSDPVIRTKIRENVLSELADAPLW